MSVTYYSGYSSTTERQHITDERDCLPADVKGLETLYAPTAEEALVRAAQRVVKPFIFQVGDLFYETDDDYEGPLTPAMNILRTIGRA